jgi:inorganic pyrophosphatase
MKLPTYREDGSLNVVVESPRSSAVKYKYDPREQVMTLSRPLPAGLRYPHDWGFVAGTQAPDGDPLDAMVVWDTATHPGIVIPSRAIGVLRVEQTNLESRQRERNDRVLVLPLKAPRQEHVKSAFELPERVLDELAKFFLAAVAFEGKELSILGWGGPDEAKAAVREASKAFDREN